MPLAHPGGVRCIYNVRLMLVSESRPRNLKWFHAGPLLYGDWGTSRLYVLGLAFFFTGQASVLYLVAIGLLMVAVAWAYTIICRSFPDGGGVYAAARQINPTLSVVGATNDRVRPRGLRRTSCLQPRFRTPSNGQLKA